MKVPTGTRTTLTFSDRGDALGHFFQRAGEAPRLVAYDDEVGCPLHNALAALEWTLAVGILNEDDLVHAARLGETAAAMVERRRAGRLAADRQQRQLERRRPPAQAPAHTPPAGERRCCGFF